MTQLLLVLPKAKYLKAMAHRLVTWPRNKWLEHSGPSVKLLLWTGRTIARVWDRSKAMIEQPELSLPNIQVFPEHGSELSAMISSTESFALNTVYAEHPWRPSFFIPMGSFHVYLSEEKRSEFQRLCSTLGAKSVSITHAVNQEWSLEGKLTAPLPVKLPVEAKLKAGIVHSDENLAHVRFSADAPTGPPKLPEVLCWYHHEPQWQAMAENRLNQWITSHEAVLAYTHNFGVTMELALKVKKLGLGLGPSYQDAKSTSSVHQVEFFPRSAYQSASAA